MSQEKTIKHTEGHRAGWVSSVNWCPDCKKFQGEEGLLQFVCEEWYCEVNHGGYDCPRCKEKGHRRVMDEFEKVRGCCGDCALQEAFISGKLGNGLMIKKEPLGGQNDPRTAKAIPKENISANRRL